MLNFNNKLSDDSSVTVEDNWYSQGVSTVKDLYDRIPDGGTVTVKKAATVGVGAVIVAWVISEIFG